MKSEEILKDTPFEGSNPTPYDRWRHGIDHDPRSEELFQILEAADYIYNRRAFDWESGGDGDNGEEMMYALDRYFWAVDHDTLEADKQKVGGPKDLHGRDLEVGDAVTKPYYSTLRATVTVLERPDLFWIATDEDGNRYRCHELQKILTDFDTP